MKKICFALQMETFAGFTEHTDVEIGRLVDAIDQIGELDNTPFHLCDGGQRFQW